MGRPIDGPKHTESMSVRCWRSDRLHLPHLRIAILTSRNNRLVVQPHQTSDLGLRMGVLDDRVLRWIRQRPNDDGRIERTAGN